MVTVTVWLSTDQWRFLSNWIKILFSLLKHNNKYTSERLWCVFITFQCRGQRSVSISCIHTGVALTVKLTRPRQCVTLPDTDWSRLSGWFFGVEVLGERRQLHITPFDLIAESVTTSFPFINICKVVKPKLDDTARHDSACHFAHVSLFWGLLECLLWHYNIALAVVPASCTV